MRILLIMTGSIAAYKSLDFIRRARERGHVVTPILTKGAQEFITPLSAASLAEQPAYTELFSLKDETEMGHIRLARETDVILVAPASADFMASMVQGRAQDLAGAVLLAADKPVFVAPAMNVKMWESAANQRNLAQLKADGVRVISPAAGEMACGEIGTGRMAEVQEILAAVESVHVQESLRGKHALITAGPTHEPIDPVRYIANQSSGLQGYALAEAFALAGANVTLISGPTTLKTPFGVTRVDVKTAVEMMDATEKNLPADIGIFTAAVADWRVENAGAQKFKKRENGEPPVLRLVENPDILKTIAAHKNRPTLVVGFAAETEYLEAYARAKMQRKSCDWMVATDVSGGKSFGTATTSVLLLQGDAPAQPLLDVEKTAVAKQLVALAAQHFSSSGNVTAFPSSNLSKRKKA